MKVSTELQEETGEPEAAISFSIWLQRNIGNLTRLDLTIRRPMHTFKASKILQTVSSATQLCSLRLDLDQRYLSTETFAGFSALTNLTNLTVCSCSLSFPTFSSILALTQLRALDLSHVHVDADGEGQGEGEEEEEREEYDMMAVLTRHLVNLTSLALDSVSGCVDLEEGFEGVRSLPNLVDLDIRGMVVPSGSLVSLTKGLPITGIKIRLDDAEHVSEVAGWLERCVPTTLRCLYLFIPGYPKPCFELLPCEVAPLLSPLRSAGAQLQELDLSSFGLSQAGSVSIITELTQLTSLDLLCNFHDDGWTLLEPAFAHLGVLRSDRVPSRYGMPWFKVALLRQVHATYGMPWFKVGFLSQVE